MQHDAGFLSCENEDGKKCASVEDKRVICRMLIKCADVSNPSRPWPLCKEWGLRIVDEYFAQVIFCTYQYIFLHNFRHYDDFCKTAEERAKGLPLTMEVFDKDACNIPQTQCSFIDMFVREMFRGWCGKLKKLIFT